MRSKIWLAMAALAVLSLTLIGCSSATASASASTALSVELNDFTFKPDTFTVAAGKDITLNLNNTGKVKHEFVIIKAGQKATTPWGDDDEAKVQWETEVEAGAKLAVKFTAPTAPGSYQIVCGQPGHIEAGMVGTLNVVP